MSGTLNKVMLIGHLGDEVKIHRFEDGGCVGRFPLATNETYMNKQTNERVSNTEWHNVVLRNKAAEICEESLENLLGSFTIFFDTISSLFCCSTSRIPLN